MLCHSDYRFCNATRPEFPGIVDLFRRLPFVEASVQICKLFTIDRGEVVIALLDDKTVTI